MEPASALLRIWTVELVVVKVFNWVLGALMLVSAVYGIYHLEDVQVGRTFLVVAVVFMVATFIGGSGESRLERRMGAPEDRAVEV